MPGNRSAPWVLVTDDVAAGVSGAAFVHTDVWVSMGESDDEWTRRVPLLTPYLSLIHI